MELRPVFKTNWLLIRMVLVFLCCSMEDRKIKLDVAWRFVCALVHLCRINNSSQRLALRGYANLWVRPLVYRFHGTYVSESGFCLQLYFLGLWSHLSPTGNVRLRKRMSLLVALHTLAGKSACHQLPWENDKVSRRTNLPFRIWWSFLSFGWQE